MSSVAEELDQIKERNDAEKCRIKAEKTRKQVKELEEQMEVKDFLAFYSAIDCNDHSYDADELERRNKQIDDEMATLERVPNELWEKHRASRFASDF